MYIEREAFRKAFEVAPDEWVKGRTVMAILDSIPAAAVQPIVEGASHDGEQDVAPVVRCTQCRFSEHNEESGYWHCRSVSALNRIVKPDDFCSYGERRTKDV